MSYQEDFDRFKATVPVRQHITSVPDERTWQYYDFGPREERTPVIFLPGVSGTHDIFFRQFLSLGSKGYRLISVNYPAFYTHEDFVFGFEHFLDGLNIAKCHLVGASLGGFMAQCVAELRPKRVESLVLCNTFADTHYFADNSGSLINFARMMPTFVLKRIVLQNFPTGLLESEISESIDFMVDRLESLGHTELAARLTLNCVPKSLKALRIPLDRITIIDTVDDVVVPTELREQLYLKYEGCRMGLIKTGGNFPYLSRYSDFNLQLEVHLRHVKQSIESPSSPPPSSASAASSSS